MKEHLLSAKLQNAFFEFLNAKFENNEIDFKQFVDAYKNSKDKNFDPYLYRLLENKNLFEELIQNNRLNKDNFKYLLDTIDKHTELRSLSGNIILLKHIVDKDIVAFKELVDKFKNIKDFNNKPCLYRLLYNEELFEELVQNNRLNIDDLKYLLNELDKSFEFQSLSGNTILLKYIIDKDILSFKELVDKFKSMKDAGNDPCLYKLLANKGLFEELIQNNLLNKEDLRYLLNTIDKAHELLWLNRNTLLIKHILNEFVLDKELVDRFNSIMESDRYWFKEHNIHTIFDSIEYHNKNDKEILKLIELNKKVCLLNILNLNEDQKLELIELIQNNKLAKNRLIQIINNHLESNYDFDSLMRHLKKTEKKNLINI